MLRLVARLTFVTDLRVLQAGLGRLRLPSVRLLSDIFGVKNLFEFSVGVQRPVSQTVLRAHILVIP